jgi:hypothetical protein
VSQTPPPGGSQQQTKKPQDANSTQLGNLLKQNQIHVNSVDDFLNAYTAIQHKQQLNPDQEKTLGAFTKAVVAKPGLTTQIAGLMKSMSANKPAGQAAPQQAPGTPQPAAGV